MNIIVCGAGEVGSHVAEVLAAEGNNITVIDTNGERLRAIEESMDVATYHGSGVDIDVQTRAGVKSADLLIGATDSDEVNLLAASLAKGLGAKKSIARVHHSAFFDQRGLLYQDHLGIDQLICPEYSTALAIARRLRNPGALAVENIARGRIEMQELTVGQKGSAVGKRLMDVRVPTGTRLALIRRKQDAFIPEAKSVVAPGDSIILVGNEGAFEDARKLFQAEKPTRNRIVLMGGTPMAVWLCRSLRDRNFAVRLFEKDRRRAEVLAEKLDWVTIIQSDPTDRNVFAEENLGKADVFIPLVDSDEANIIAGVLAKTRGVAQVITVVQQSKYLDLVYDIGVDHVFSTHRVAAQEIDSVLDDSPLRHLGSLAEGYVDVYRVRVGDDAPVLGKPLRDIKLSPDWVVAALQRDRNVFVPNADDVIERGNLLMVVGRSGKEATLTRLFAAG